MAWLDGVEMTVIQGGDSRRIAALGQTDDGCVCESEGKTLIAVHELSDPGEIILVRNDLCEITGCNGFDKIDFGLGTDVLSNQVAGFS
ncbi:hypothetical protein NOGI109294_09945 [Nocardiopsis gilva]|nr:hypothetical protein [Nocardiopsis gilva]